MGPVSLFHSLYTTTGQLLPSFTAKGNHLFAAQEWINLYRTTCVILLGVHLCILGYFGASKMECSGGQTYIVTLGWFIVFFFPRRPNLQWFLFKKLLKDQLSPVSGHASENKALLKHSWKRRIVPIQWVVLPGVWVAQENWGEPSENWDISLIENLKMLGSHCLSWNSRIDEKILIHIP